MVSVVGGGLYFLLLGGTTSVSSAAGGRVSDRIISSWSIPDGHVLFKLLRSTRRSTLPNIIPQYITKYSKKPTILIRRNFPQNLNLKRLSLRELSALCERPLHIPGFMHNPKRWVDLTAWFTRSCTSSCVSAIRLFERRCRRRPDLK